MAILKNQLDEIRKKSQILSSLKPLAPDLQEKLERKFRLEFNYNSNHLEGNTLTYNETELLLIFDQTEGSHDYREYQEMQAHDVALKMIKQEAEDTERPLTEQFIRSLNEHLLVRPFWKDAITTDGQATRKQIVPGQYKLTPNSVQLQNGEIFHYTSPADVPKEMNDLVRWYNENRGKEEPIILASLLHYRFVRIHPFDDGNGRTARLLMNYVLLQNDLPLVIIKSSEKKSYLSALNRADTGDLNAFSEYICNQLLWSLNISIRAANGEDIAEDDDLDKELDLLKKDLYNIPNEYDKKKSQIEVANVMNRSIIPFFFELHSKIEKIVELFVEVNEYISLKHNGEQRAYLHKFDYKKLLESVEGEKLIAFDQFNITEVTIVVECIALKKVLETTNVVERQYIFMDDYHYGIIDTDNQVIIRLPFGRYFSKENIDKAVKAIMYKVINQIKEATNLEK